MSEAKKTIDDFNIDGINKSSVDVNQKVIKRPFGSYWTTHVSTHTLISLLAITKRSYS